MTDPADKSLPPKPGFAMEPPDGPGAESMALAVLEAVEHHSQTSLPALKAPLPQAEPAQSSIDAALSQLSAQADVPTVPLAHSVVRAYSLREVGRLLAACAAVLFLLDADGMLTWVRRMEVGRAQTAWLAVAVPVQKGFDAVGLTAPRRGLTAAAEALSRGLGAGEDPLFAEAWGLVEVAPYLDAVAQESLEGMPSLSPVPSKVELPVVLLVGDSLFAGNLAAAIGRSFAREGKARVVSAYQTATGLSRPDIFDWGRVVAPLIAREHPRWVVCSFGANDAQSIRVGDDLLGFGDASWESVYEQRVRTMMRQAASGGARVLWLGLPPMREETFDLRSRQLNAIFKRVARSVPNVDYLETSPLFAGPDGTYATFVRSGGKLVRMRMDDGVHYAPAGAQNLARKIHDWAN